MNPRDFVQAIKRAVSDAAAKGTLDALVRPSGRRPDAQLVKLSEWYCGRDPDSRDKVAQIVELASQQATYNFLLALDGLLALEASGPKGKLELFHVKGGTRTRLNDENGEQLSGLFKA